MKANLKITSVALVLSLLAAELMCRLATEPPPSFEVIDRQPLPTSNETLRIVDKRLPYRMVDKTPHGLRLKSNLEGIIRNHALSKRDIILRTNTYGLRGGEVGAFNGPRILVLGDSITLADYLAEDETIPALLENKFGGKYTFLNGGIATTGTEDQFYRYLELRDVINPKVVLIGMFLDDARATQPVRVQQVPRWLSVSRLASRFVSNISLLKAHLYTPEVRIGEQKRIHDMESLWSQEGWAPIETAIRLFREDTRARDVTFGIFLFPLANQVIGKKDSTPQRKFGDMCDRVGVACFDLLPALKKAHSLHPGDPLHFDFCHMTLRGHQAVVEELSPWLTELLQDLPG